MPRELNLNPRTKPADCPLCGGLGTTVDHEKREFVRCPCPKGQAGGWGVDDAIGPIHPEDYAMLRAALGMDDAKKEDAPDDDSWRTF